MSPVPGNDVPRGPNPEEAAPFPRAPDVAQTPAQAREIDYGLRASIGGIWLMAGYSVPIFVLALLLARASLLLVAFPVGLLIFALVMHVYLRQTSRRRLALFISPIDGQLDIPGGRRELTLRSLIRRKGT